MKIQLFGWKLSFFFKEILYSILFKQKLHRYFLFSLSAGEVILLHNKIKETLSRSFI